MAQPEIATTEASRGLATDGRSGFVAGGSSHHPCATDGILLEEAHGVFRSGIPGRRGLYGPRQLGDGFGRRRTVRIRRFYAVIMISNLMAILLQHLCIKLGVATGRDLAQACRDHYPMTGRLVSLDSFARSRLLHAIWLKWLVRRSRCSLLFGIPLVWGCIITASDVLAGSISPNQRISLH